MKVKIDPRVWDDLADAPPEVQEEFKRMVAKMEAAAESAQTPEEFQKAMADAGFEGGPVEDEDDPDFQEAARRIDNPETEH